MTKSTSLQTDSLRGEYWTRESAAKLQGRRLPNALRALRSLRRPCSGRTAPVPHLGPPTAPRRTASADWAAERAESVRGFSWASIEA